MKEVILFDFDGTIADSFENFLEIITTLSSKYNLPAVSHQELNKLRSKDPRSLIKTLKIPLYKIPLIARDMKKMQQQHITTIKPFRGLSEILRRLSDRGYILGIVTSNGKENVQLFIHNHNIAIFTYIHSDTSMFGKDKVLRNFLKKNAMSKEQVIYVGDEIRDIQACQKAGIKIVAVTWGFNSKEGLAKYNPDFLIDNPADLLHVFRK